MSIIRGLVIDVDDTLYLERDYVRSGFDYVDGWLSSDHGVEGVGAEAWRLFLAGVRRTTLGDALKSVGADAGLLSDCVARYRAHSPAIRMLPDSENLLKSLKGRVPIAVVTDGPAVSQRAKCAGLGLLEHADRVVITEEMGSSKPDPAVFHAAVAGWGLSPDQLIYVADNPAKDFIAPLQMGWSAVRVRREMSLHVDVDTPADVDECYTLDRVADRCI